MLQIHTINSRVTRKKSILSATLTTPITIAPNARSRKSLHALQKTTTLYIWEATKTQSLPRQPQLLRRLRKNHLVVQ